MCGKVPFSYRFSATLLLASGVVWSATSSPQRCSLQPEHAAILVMQTPTVVKAKASGGCPAADYQEKTPGMAAFEVRDICAKSGDPVIGSYLVDVNNGDVFADGAAENLDSPDLRATRNRVCAMSVQGVIPSLLPQGHTSRARVRRIGTPPASKTTSASSKKTSTLH